MKKTLLLKVDPENPPLQKIRVAADIIRKGGLVAFPTETVYGLGADALNADAVLSVFRVKKRPLDNPPIVHVNSKEMVHKLAKKVPAEAERLMKRFWPGPLTLIFFRSEMVPSVTVAGLDTVALRMPNHKVALALISDSNCSIAAPSANLAGKPSPTTARHVLDDFEGKIDAVLDAGPTHIGVESTVLDLTVSPPQILRPGGTLFESLKEVLDQVEINPAAIAEEPTAIVKARSPGMKHRHYAPVAELVVVEGELPAVTKKIRQLAQAYRKAGRTVGILATDQTASDYDVGLVRSMGSRTDLRTVAKNLFALLRQFDAEGVEVIVAEGVPPRGLGLAIMNRLRKASGYRIIKAHDDD
jgi:L-threonylcarbamoyladenylate synthase